MSFGADFVMPPQPLSRVRRNAITMATPDALKLRPSLTPLIAEVIARWGYVEANIGSILAYLLRAEAATTVAMLHAIKSSSAQMEMILAAGWAKLFDPELEMFEAVIRNAQAVAKKRNAVAHHVWAYAAELPDALLLIEPEVYTDLFVQINQQPHAQVDESRILMKKTMVYREGDFIEIINELNTTSRCTTFLINYLQPNNRSRDRMYSLLCSEPSIDAALQLLKKNRQPRLTPPPPTPQTESE